jgi:hypothetical protein
MKTFIALALAALSISGCGGDDPPIPPLARCNGTPRAAVVYVGSAAFPELAGVPNACVYGTQAQTIAQLDAVVDRALGESGKKRVYLIGAYTDLPLKWRAARPGIGEITSLWFVPDGSSAAGIQGSVATVFINDTADGARTCNELAVQLKAQGTAAVCQLWDEAGSRRRSARPPSSNCTWS